MNNIVLGDYSKGQSSIKYSNVTVILVKDESGNFVEYIAPGIETIGKEDVFEGSEIRTFNDSINYIVLSHIPFVDSTSDPQINPPSMTKNDENVENVENNDYAWLEGTNIIIIHMEVELGDTLKVSYTYKGTQSLN